MIYLCLQFNKCDLGDSINALCYEDGFDVEVCGPHLEYVDFEQSSDELSFSSDSMDTSAYSDTSTCGTDETEEEDEVLIIDYTTSEEEEEEAVDLLMYFYHNAPQRLGSLNCDGSDVNQSDEQNDKSSVHSELNGGRHTPTAQGSELCYTP